MQQTDTEHGRVSGCDGPPLRKRNEATGRSVKACLGRSRQPETRMSRGAGVGRARMRGSVVGGYARPGTR